MKDINSDEIQLSYRAKKKGDDFKNITLGVDLTNYNLTDLSPKTEYEVELKLVCLGINCKTRNVLPSSFIQYTSAIPPYRIGIIAYFNKAVKFYWAYPTVDAKPEKEYPEYVAISLISDRCRSKNVII